MKLTGSKVNVLKALMKNPKMSDRAAARIAGVSQPTVSRARAKLERAGIIKGYSIIPDLAKIGYNIMAFSEIDTLDKHLLAGDLLRVQGELSKDPRAIFVMRNPQRIVIVSRHKDINEFTDFSMHYRIARSLIAATEKGIIKDFGIREL